MKIDININPSEAVNDFAKVTLHCEALKLKGTLDLNFSTLYTHCQIPNPIIFDFLFLASTVYCADRLIPHTKGNDRWGRTFELCLPVSDYEKWFSVTESLQSCLSFLTGDDWKIQFKSLPGFSDMMHCPERIKEHGKSINADAVCLFSGGLDSLIGAIDYMESGKRPFLVGHYASGSGPKSDQENLHEILEKEYGSLNLLQVRVGLKTTSDQDDQEKTYRSRSFLFIVLGMYAAQSIGEQIPLLIPENGTIALNPPLTPSRQGSCSTRTAHPFFLNMLREILDKLGIENILCNPLQFKTKGECVDSCQNKNILRDAVPISVSCAKVGHNYWWPDSGANGCGICIPCIYRQAALFKVGWDDERYGRKICDVDLDADKDYPDDFRALVSFLHHKHGNQDISKLLLANGDVELTDLEKYAAIVERGMEEVRDWIRAKGPDKIKHRAGIVS